MTNINCSRKCVYQSDGKCCLDSITMSLTGCKAAGGSNCAYQTDTPPAESAPIGPENVDSLS